MMMTTVVMIVMMMLMVPVSFVTILAAAAVSVTVQAIFVSITTDRRVIIQFLFLCSTTISSHFEVGKQLMGTTSTVTRIRGTAARRRVQHTTMLVICVTPAHCRHVMH